MLLNGTLTPGGGGDGGREHSLSDGQLSKAEKVIEAGA